MKKKCIVPLLFLLGCSSPVPIVACIDTSEETFEEIRSGVQAWNKSTSSWREWKSQSKFDSTCNLMIRSVDPKLNLCDNSIGIYACSEPVKGLISDESPQGRVNLYRGVFERAPKGVVMHEIGHLIGLQHQDGTLMQALWPPNFEKLDWDCPDPKTISNAEDELGESGFVSCPFPKEKIEDPSVQPD